MTIVDTTTYERIRKKVEEHPNAVYMSRDDPSIRNGLDNIVNNFEQNGYISNNGYGANYIFVMNNRMTAKFSKECGFVTDHILRSFKRSYLGYDIVHDAHMIAETVLFIDLNYVALSGRILNIQRVGVIDFSDTEQETEE